MVEPKDRTERDPGRVASGHYRLIQAGRGAACLCVVFFHSLLAFTDAKLPTALEDIRALSRRGWVGVHIFFAISGWCIAERLAKGMRAGESGGHFAIERALRIFPTYWAAFIASIVLLAVAAPFNTAHLSNSMPRDLTDWVGSILLISPYLGRGQYLFVSWSLVYELGFYLCAALALVAARRRVTGGTLLFIVGCVMCLGPGLLRHGSLIWRVLELWPNFFAGVAAWWAVRRGAKVLGYGALALMLYATLAWPAYGGAGRVTAVATGWLLALAYRYDAAFSQAKPMRFFIWMGGISYSLYLIHVPLMSPTLNLLGRWIPPFSPWFIAVWLAAVLVAVAGARFLNRFVELPVESWRKRST